MEHIFLPAESLLTLDIGSSLTRATLFEGVEGSYRRRASGLAPTTAYLPAGEIRRGIRWALDELSAATGKPLVDENGRLLRPVSPGDPGVDHLSATYSIAPPIKLLAAGLSTDFSLASLRKLARCIPYQSLTEVNLQDGLGVVQHLDAIVSLRPDLVLLAGGSDGGASRAVLVLVDTLALACSLIPEGQRPLVLFCGNQDLAPAVQSRLGRLVKLETVANLRPQSEQEDLAPAMHRLIALYHELCKLRIPWLARLESLVQGNLGYGGYALGRLIRFLNQMHPGTKGVLGLNLGISATTLAASFAGELALQVFPEYGLGQKLADQLSQEKLAGISRWLLVEMPDSFIREYLLNKSLYPESMPMALETLQLEQAIARSMLQQALQQASKGFSSQATRLAPGLLPAVEPIIASGALLTQAPDPIQNLLILLDGLQPTGITTLVLDPHQLAPGLGQAALTYPNHVVQVLGTDAFEHLATVISPVGQARPGTPIVRIKLALDEGEERSLEIRQGELRRLPLLPGQTARLQLTPLQQFDIGMGSPGRGGTLRVTGSILGVVIDGRGRPLGLPGNPDERRALLTRWSGGLHNSQAE
jgi:hypothetical protein